MSAAPTCICITRPTQQSSVIYKHTQMHAIALAVPQPVKTLPFILQSCEQQMLDNGAAAEATSARAASDPGVAARADTAL